MRRALSVLLMVFLANQATGQEPATKPGQTSKPGAAKKKTSRPLITAVDLNKILSQDRVRILDVGTDKKVYDAGHVPGSVFVHWIQDMTDPKNNERYNLATPKAMQRVLRRLGIKNEDRIVIYDNLSNRLSTRLYWSLKTYGHHHVQVLDGGQGAWKAAGLNFTTEVPGIAPSEYRIGKAAPRFSADMKYITKQLGEPNVSLVDGRPEKQFSGAEPGRVFHTGTAHKKRGHIPGAVNVFWKDNFKPDGTFKSAKELKALYEKRGITRGKGKVTVTYCNEGLHAAPPWFVLRELLGYEDVRVYDDSLSE